MLSCRARPAQALERAGERATLAGYLRDYRLTAELKCAGGTRHGRLLRERIDRGAGQ